MRLSPDKIDEKDLKYAPVDADADFDPAHNKRVIENVIRKTEANQRAKSKVHIDKVKERTSALADYLKSIEQGGKKTDIEAYFGRKYIAHLRGQEVIERLKNGLTVYNKQGQVVRRPGEA